MRAIEIETARAAAAAATPPRPFVGLVGSSRAAGTVDGSPAFVVSVPVGRVLTDPEADAWNRKNAAAVDAETDAATARVSELVAIDPGVTSAREKLARLRASVADAQSALAADRRALDDAQRYWLRALAAGADPAAAEAERDAATARITAGEQRSAALARLVADGERQLAAAGAAARESASRIARGELREQLEAIGQPLAAAVAPHLERLAVLRAVLVRLSPQ
jgi:hypothetical protein